MVKQVVEVADEWGIATEQGIHEDAGEKDEWPVEAELFVGEPNGPEGEVVCELGVDEGVVEGGEGEGCGVDDEGDELGEGVPKNNGF